MPMKDPTTGEEYDDWDDCISNNQDKDDPDKYCGWVKKKSEEKMENAEDELRELEEQISGDIQGGITLKEELDDGERLETYSKNAIKPNTEKNIVVEGLLLPKNEVSRNNVLYDWERIQEVYENLIGKKMFYNHKDDTTMPPLGKFVDTWLVDDDSDQQNGWYYRAQVQKDTEYAESIRAGNLDKVSIQVIAGRAVEEENDQGEGYTRAFISTIKEASLVGVPGFTQTSLGVAINEALSESSIFREEITEEDRKPNQGMKEAARQALEWAEEYDWEKTSDDSPGRATGWERANQIDNGESLSLDTWQRMHSFFERHGDNALSIDDEYEGEPWKDHGYVSGLLWGGKPGKEKAARMNEKIEEEEATGQTTANNPGVTVNKKPGDEEPDVSLGEGDGPCWDGYTMVGTKQQDGKTVPRCVPEEMATRFNERGGRVVAEDGDEIVIEVKGENRGLVVGVDGEKYDVEYWYESVDEIAPVNVLADGEKVAEAEEVTLGIHADSYEGIEEQLKELQNHF